MKTVGTNIVEMQKIMQVILSPPPSWIRAWQTEAEHILAMAHSAKDGEDWEKLRILDEEAGKLVARRQSLSQAD